MSKDLQGCARTARRRHAGTMTIVGAGLLVSACGGGGGVNSPSSTPAPTASTNTNTSSGSTIATTPVTPAAPVRSDEYKASGAVVGMNAGAAYDKNLTGAGVTVAVIDTGIDVGNSEFAGRVSANSKSFDSMAARCGTCAPETVSYPLQDIAGHGTETASILGAAVDGKGTQGVAPSVTILALKITSPDMTGVTATSGPLPEGTGANAANIAPAITYAIDHGAFAITMSLNGTSSGQTAAEQRPAMDYVAKNDRLVIESVSNSIGDDSAATGSIAANLVGPNGENKDWFLFGIRVDSAKNAPSGNGLPGTLADRTLAVVASNVTVAKLGGGTDVVTGNSFAAPAIAGAAALLKQNWPQLGGKQIAQILLSSADDLGTPGVDQLYGVGLLDLAKALQAQSATLGVSAISAVPLASSSLSFGGAFGGADAGRGFARRVGSVVSLDRFGRDYRVALAALTSGSVAGGIRLRGTLAPQPAIWMPEPIGQASAARLTGSAAAATPAPANMPRSFTFAVSPRTTVSGQIDGDIESSSLATGAMLRSSGLATTGQSLMVNRDGVRIAFATAATSYRAHAAGSGEVRSATRRVGVELRSGLRLGMTDIEESGAALGLAGTGAFRIVGGHSTFATFGWTGAIGSIRLTGDAMLGATRVESGSTMMRFSGPLLASGFRLQADRAALGGVATLGLTAPLRVERAMLTMTLPTGYDLASESLVTTTRRLDLAPGGREMNLELGWTTAVAGRASLRLAVAHAFDCGQVRGASSDAGFVTLALR